MKDIKPRLIVITIILPIFIFIIHFSVARYIFFTATIALFGIFILLELLAMFKNKNHSLSSPVIIIQLLLCISIAYLSVYLPISPPYIQLFCILNILIIPCFYVFKSNIENETINMLLHIFLFLYAIIPLLLVVFMFMTVPHPSAYFLFFLSIVWSSNSSAYLVGTSIKNRHPVGLSVSPNKSIEGFIGGIFFGTAIPLSLYYIFFTSFNFSLLKLLFIVISINVFTIIGDLFESALKRYCEVKDSSALFKGHGGLLDMSDSIIFSFPLFYLSLSYLR